VADASKFRAVTQTRTPEPKDPAAAEARSCRANSSDAAIRFVHFGMEIFPSRILPLDGSCSWVFGILSEAEEPALSEVERGSCG
jgi:hypothetical protein